ncbi:MAG: hypothetical protein LBJ10_11025, partial [Clostridiales bacterium]|nr:hypothetical protein [Clostridiales bacterium]
MRRRVLKSFTALALACIVLIGGLPSQAFAGTPAPEPVQSKKSWADAAYMLPESLAGEVTVEYDITVNKASINGVVALSSAGQNVGSWQDAQTALRAHEDGYFDVRDGGDYGSLATVAYEQGGTYSVRETVSTGASSATYSVWVNGTIIAESFLQRAATPALADVGQIVLISQTGAEADWEDGEFSLSNIKVNGSPVALSSKRNIHTEPTTLSVGPGEGYATPAAALVDAIPGDTIMI